MKRSFEAPNTIARTRSVFDVGLVILLLSQTPWISAAVPLVPMPIPFEDTIRHRWLSKPVAESRLLDDMEDLAGWTHHGYGEVALTMDRSKDGKRCLRLTSPTKGDKPGPTLGRPFGAAVVRRDFDGEDWSGFNRLSFWVYPTLPGFRTISLCVVLYNDGREKVPGPYGRNGRNFVLLEPDRWNHVVWEIAHLGRDRVTGVEFSYRLQGNEPGATTTVTYDLDRLELQTVQSDHFEGWDVAAGRIAYCHTGYPLHGSKTAIATNIQASVFSLLEATSGQTLLTRPIIETTSRIGTFQLLDFSAVFSLLVRAKYALSVVQAVERIPFLGTERGV